MHYPRYTREELFRLLDEAICQQMVEGDVKVGTIAAAVHMSPSRLARSLNHYGAPTPASYILHCRMQEARRMLRLYPCHSITEVALHCGFADNSHFAHAFRRCFGMSPMGYVKQNAATSSTSIDSTDVADEKVHQ